jgi:hypothetical protein
METQRGRFVSGRRVNAYYAEKVNITGHFEQSGQWATPASPGSYIIEPRQVERWLNFNLENLADPPK